MSAARGAAWCPHAGVAHASQCHRSVRPAAPSCVAQSLLCLCTVSRREAHPHCCAVLTSFFHQLHTFWAHASVPRRAGDPEVNRRRQRRSSQLQAISTPQPDQTASTTRQSAQLPPVSRLFPAAHVEVTPELVAYAPVGCLVAASRALVWVVCALVDSPALTDSDGALGFILTSLLGVTATWSGLENIPPGLGFHVAVSNHTCVGDFLALYAQRQQYNHLIHHAVPTGGRVTRHRVQFTHADLHLWRQLVLAVFRPLDKAACNGAAPHVA